MATTVDYLVTTFQKVSLQADMGLVKQEENKNGIVKGQSVKAILNELLEETNENGVTNKQLLAEKILALALNGHEGMIKFVWANVDGKTKKYLVKERNKPYMDSITVKSPLWGGYKLFNWEVKEPFVGLSVNSFIFAASCFCRSIG